MCFEKVVFYMEKVYSKIWILSCSQNRIAWQKSDYYVHKLKWLFYHFKLCYIDQLPVQSHGLVKYRYINASLINRLNIWSIKYELVYTHEWVLITLIMHSIFLEEMLNWLWSHVSDIFWETFSFHILCTLGIYFFSSHN